MFKCWQYFRDFHCNITWAENLVHFTTQSSLNSSNQLFCFVHFSFPMETFSHSDSTKLHDWYSWRSVSIHNRHRFYARLQLFGLRRCHQNWFGFRSGYNTWRNSFVKLDAKTSIKGRKIVKAKTVESKWAYHHDTWSTDADANWSGF